MKFYASLFISLLLISFFVSVCAALTPDAIVITTDKPWLTAGGTDPATITVHIINYTSPEKAVTGSKIQVWCSDDLLGKVTPAGTKTVNAGDTNMTFTFTPKTKSGAAIIHAVITHPDMDGSLETTLTLQVDHASPSSFAQLTYPSESPIQQVVNITVRLKDKYGNIVDSRKEIEEGTTGEVIKFTDSPDGDGGFLNGREHSNEVYIPVDEEGYFSLQYLVSSIAGDNIISIVPPSSVTPSTTYIIITGYGIITSDVFMKVDTDPPSGVIRANNLDTIAILYSVLDSFGNPAQDVNIIQTTSLGESNRFTTNNEGQVLTYYGPKEAAGVVTISAAVEEFPNTQVTHYVEFVPADPQLWVLTASPQTLASRDVAPYLTSDVIARVMDSLGNPVQGETISFMITNTTTLPSVPLEQSPCLLEISAVTDVNGMAVVRFQPGAFYTSGLNYNETATGISTIKATWNGETKYISISFKNYPYLRIETSVSPPTVVVNESVDVTIRLVGDGWALRPKPIDVDLVFDQSGSMGYDSPTRISQAKTAAKTFVDQMDPSNDRVGLVSFSSTSTLKQSLTSTLSTVKTKIDSLSANGATQLRNAAFIGITDVKSKGRSEAVKAIILMTDGEWNYDGSPLGHGTGWPSNNTGYTFSGNTIEPNNYRWYDGLGGNLTYYCSVYSTTTCDVYADYCNRCASGYTLNNGKCCYYSSCYYPSQKPSSCSVKRCNIFYCNSGGYTCTDGESTAQNLSIYAKNNNIRIYAISFAADLDPIAVAGLTTLANNTGGFYEHAPNGAKLTEIYKRIAGDLKTTSGVNTWVNLSFQNLNVTYNNETISMPGDQVFTYQYVDGVSTNISSWNTTTNPLPNHNPPYPYTLDQSNEWSTKPLELNFDVGNISINQTWQTTIRLKVLTPGSISIFGSKSKVGFLGHDGVLINNVPDTYITSVLNMTPQPANQPNIDVEITDIKQIGSGPTTDYLDVYWKLNYSGNKTVNQVLYYQYSPDNILWANQWIAAGSVPTNNGPFVDHPFLNRIIVIGKSGWLKIKVSAKEMVVGGRYDEDIKPDIISINLYDGYILIR